MSGRRQERDRARLERLEREREQQARERRRRLMTRIGAVAAVLAVGALTAVVVVTVTGGDDGGVGDGPGAGSAAQSDLLASEAAADAQASAAAEAMANGEVLPDDHTVEPGMAVGEGPPPFADDRPVACDAGVPSRADTPRPLYPGGPAEVLQDGIDYRARIDTSCGPIVIDLLEDDAPTAVNSFVFLAREGYYDGLEVFRDFGAVAAAQAGSGDNTVNGDVGYRLPDELDLAERDGYPVGTVTTAGEGPYTAGSEFFLVYGEEFEAGYADNRIQTVLGRVTSGLPILDTIAAEPRSGAGGEEFGTRLMMESVTILERPRR